MLPKLRKLNNIDRLLLCFFLLIVTTVVAISLNHNRTHGIAAKEHSVPLKIPAVPLTNDDDTSSTPLPNDSQPMNQAQSNIVNTPSINNNSPAKCHMSGGLPDTLCTPGFVDPTVTQENINQTICVSGYSKTVRPSSSYTTQLKIQQIKEYGFIDTKTADYEEDHLISLELGGAPTDVRNLWPEPGKSPNPKDSIENKLHALVCSGKLRLSDAQQRIATNWETALNGL
jgi:hypothetical protein